MASGASKVSIVAGSVAFNRALRNGGGLSCQGCSLLRSISLFRRNTAMQVQGSDSSWSCDARIGHSNP